MATCSPWPQRAIPFLIPPFYSFLFVHAPVIHVALVIVGFVYVLTLKNVEKNGYSLPAQSKLAGGSAELPYLNANNVI